jgi:hypothetical protein
MLHAFSDLEVVMLASLEQARGDVVPGSVTAIVIGVHWLPATQDLRALAELAELRLAPVLLLSARSDATLARRALVLGIEDIVDWECFVGPRIATMIGACTERHRLQQEVQRSRQRAAHLHAVCTGLAVVGSELEVATAILDGVALFGGVASAILLREGDELVLLHSRGRATHTVNRFTRIAVAARDNPASQAARTARAVWIEHHIDLVANYGTDHGLEPAGTRCVLPPISAPVSTISGPGRRRARLR